MNYNDRAHLDVVPTPVVNGEPGRACVIREADGHWRTAWLTDTAKGVFGPNYLRVREACAAARYLNDRAAS